MIDIGTRSPVDCQLIIAVLTPEIINPAFITTFDANVTTATLDQIKNWTVWSFGITIVVVIGIYLFDAWKSLTVAFKRA